MISKGTEYAFRSLVCIEIKNRDGIRPGYRHIAREIEAPEQYTAKILQNLVRFGIIDAVRGRGGGFSLGRDAEGISVYEIIKIMEGEYFFEKCGFGLKNCSATNPCPMHDRYKVIRDAYYRLVNSESVATLADRITRGEAVINHL